MSDRTRNKFPRRIIALGEPFDDGTVPKAPEPETVEDRLTRLEKMLARIEATVRILKEGRP